MLVRKATKEDSEDLFIWRNDPVTRSVSFSSTKIKKPNHNSWFKESLESKTRVLFIGEVDNQKVGVCRFDKASDGESASISINLNPSARSKGLSVNFLNAAINKYVKYNKINIIAGVKKTNDISLKIFKKAGFHQKSYFDEDVELILPIKFLQFKSIGMSQAKALYDLLKEREHSISHKKIPTLVEHNKFVANHPYLHWLMIVHNKKNIGSVYIQNNNSIGLNIKKNYTEPHFISQIIEHISKNFTPMEAVNSQIPDYFYLNTSLSNQRLIEVYKALGIKGIQVSHKLP